MMALARWRHHHQGSVVSEADADHYDWKSQYFWSRNTIFSHGVCCVPNGAENNRRPVPSNNAFSRRLFFFSSENIFRVDVSDFCKIHQPSAILFALGFFSNWIHFQDKNVGVQVRPSRCSVFGARKKKVMNREGGGQTSKRANGSITDTSRHMVWHQGKD